MCWNNFFLMECCVNVVVVIVLKINLLEGWVFWWVFGIEDYEKDLYSEFVLFLL